MTKPDDELAALKARVDELERAAKPPEPFKPMSDGEWRDMIHRGREAQMSRVPVSPEILRDMAAACPDHVVKDIVAHGTMQSPSQAGTSGQVTVVRGAPGTGWQREIPLGPQPGIRLVDAIAIADDVRQRKARGE